MSIQLRAGYLAGAIRERFGHDPDTFARHVLEHLTAFELKVQGPVDPSPVDDPILAVADNLISRGLPTLPSLRVERALADVTGLTREEEAKGSISFPFESNLDAEDQHLLRRALVPVDPSITASEVAHDLDDRLDSPAERRFLRQDVPRHLGPWAPQVLRPQRPLDTILPEGETLKFERQRVDFVVQFPTHPPHKRGVVIEIDGVQHAEKGQRLLDEKRNAACQDANWAYSRPSASDTGEVPASSIQSAIQHIDHPYARILAENYKSPLWSSTPGKRWLHLALVPILVARIQKTLIHLIREGYLHLSRPQWQIAVIERDVPSARLAIRDLEDLLGHLFDLEGEGRRVPDINLRICRPEDREHLAFEGHPPDEILNMNEEAYGTSPFDDAFQPELLLDASVLLRSGLRPLPTSLVDSIASQAVRGTVRSSHAPTTTNMVKAGRPVSYSVPEPMEDRVVGAEDVESNPQLRPLLYLLQNVFRKEVYRPNQVDILCESLQGRSVIGLLPTGAGKSLTYQLSALLQPGLTLVVAPLKSLMHDQHANLRRAGIETTLFIDSSLTPEERREAQRAMKQGERQFVFVSPERLQIERFREHLRGLEVPVAYCVVDEGHCVSEWGHDFRTAYLRLGPNARSHCVTEWPTLPILALTGTASFDVLADVRRELDLGGETETITPDTMEREKLNFEIVEVEPPSLSPQADAWDIKKAVFERKKQVLPQVLQDMPDWFARVSDSSKDEECHDEEALLGGEENGDSRRQSRSSGDRSPVHSESDFFDLQGSETRSGLIFTPHANGSFGVQEVANQVRAGIPALRGRTGTFASSDRNQEDGELEETQEKFKDDEIGALVATKAFGMGIDKPNIRYVVHMNMSQSIESYYQQAGRAGRDRDPARCVILYCDQPVPHDEEGQVTVDEELLLFFHNSSFKGPEKEKRTVFDLLTGGADPDGEAPDLENLLGRLSPGEDSLVVIDFKDQRAVEEMSRYLSQKVSQRFTRRVVQKACDKARSADGILGKLKWIHKQVYNDWPPWGALDEHEEWLQRRFQRLRGREDTFRAVYRLSTVGVIDDYTVDYNAKVIRAHVRKRSTSGYIQAVQNYIGRYVAPERAQEIPEEVLGHRGDNIVQQCVGYLIDFVYETIAQKRRMAVKVMEDAVREGAREGNEAFRRRVNTYFDSRYLPALQSRVEDREFSLDLVWEFIRETDGVDDNINHLRGACDRLLSEYTDNGALYLLRAFTRCLTPGEPYATFKEDFREGWRLFREVKDLTWSEYLRGLSRFYREVTQLDTRLEGVISEEIARVHAEWMQTFNSTVLKTGSRKGSQS